jgi:undecaprenyl-diphosphatase
VPSSDGLALLDTRALYAVYGGQGAALRGLALAVSFVGGGFGLLALVPLFFLPTWRRLAGVLLVASASSALLVYGLKLLVARPRPCAVLPGVHALSETPTDFSFPSGHATGSFAVAVVLFVVLSAQGRRGLGALAIACAVLVAWSRVYLGVHFPVDVVAGALLGSAMGILCGRFYLRTSGAVSSPAPRVEPGAGLAP